MQTEIKLTPGQYKVVTKVIAAAWEGKWLGIRPWEMGDKLIGYFALLH